MCVFKSGLPANEGYESSKLTKKLVDSPHKLCEIGRHS